MTTVNFVILQHDTTFICISIVADSLFFVHLYMAREGIEKLLNITDKSYNILNKIDFKYNTCSITIAVSTTCIFSEFVEKKNRTCTFQQAG